MIPSTEINRIKRQVAIADLLASRGIQPVRQRGYELAYYSPLRHDSYPSFFVNVQQNVFKDQGMSDHRGDVIRLVWLLDGTDFATAVRTLLHFERLPDRPCFFLSGSSSTVPTSTDRIRQVKLLQNPTLLRYVESRRIRVGIARTYLREVHYQHEDRYLYAVGFPNDRDGYALRNGVGCKRNIGPSGISSLVGTRPGKPMANLFEGAFDFLSALEYFGQTVPTYNTYVLNSVSNLSRLLSQLERYERINVYFDRDKAGWDAFGTLKHHKLPVIDRSELYQEHNDFNEFLVATYRLLEPSYPNLDLFQQH